MCPEINRVASSHLYQGFVGLADLRIVGFMDSYYDAPLVLACSEGTTAPAPPCRYLRGGRISLTTRMFQSEYVSLNRQLSVFGRRAPITRNFGTATTGSAAGGQAQRAPVLRPREWFAARAASCFSFRLPGIRSEPQKAKSGIVANAGRTTSRRGGSCPGSQSQRKAVYAT